MPTTTTEMMNYNDITRESLESLSENQLHKLCAKFGITYFDLKPKFRSVIGNCDTRQFSIKVRTLMLLSKQLDEALEKCTISQSDILFVDGSEIRTDKLPVYRPRNELVGELLHKANQFREKARRREESRTQGMAHLAAVEARKNEEARKRIFVIDGKRYKLVAEEG